MSLPTEKWSPPPFPSCFTLSLLWLLSRCWKKVSLIVFRQIFTKSFACGAHFQFHNHNLFKNYLKILIGIKSLSTKQCPAELSTWNILTVSLILAKKYHLLSSCLLRLPCMGCPVSSPKPTIWGKPCVDERKFGLKKKSEIYIYLCIYNIYSFKRWC